MTKKRTPYPFILGIIIFCFVLFLGWSAHRASTGGTDVTDRDYYSKGLKYNTTLVEKRAATVLGWAIRASLNGPDLVIHLEDANGNPVSEARGTLLGAPGRAMLALQEQAPGEYHLALPADLTGENSFDLEFVREGARIRHRLLLKLPDPDPGRQE